MLLRTTDSDAAFHLLVAWAVEVRPPYTTRPRIRLGYSTYRAGYCWDMPAGCECQSGRAGHSRLYLTIEMDGHIPLEPMYVSTCPRQTNKAPRLCALTDGSRLVGEAERHGKTNPRLGC